MRGTEWIGTSENDRAVRNAIASFLRVFDARSLLIMVDKQQHCSNLPATLKRSHCQGLEHCMSVEFAAPTMDCIFKTLVKHASGDFVGYINGDILIFEDFKRIISHASARHASFLIVGRRRMLSPPPHIESQEAWATLLAEAQDMPFDSGTAIDYFVLRATDGHKLGNIPPFIIGNWRWDNVLLSKLLQDGQIDVIDSSRTITAVHQGVNMIERHEERPASVYNDNLAKNFSISLGNVECAPTRMRYVWGIAIEVRRTRC